MKQITTLFQVLRSEGRRAVQDHVRDFLAERRRQATFDDNPCTDRSLADSPRRPPAINLSILPPYPNRGGSLVQLLDRLAVQRHSRGTALLYPGAGGHWILELVDEEVKTQATGPTHEGSALHLHQAIEWARSITGVGLVHIENLFGIAVDELGRAMDGTGALIVGVHDFTAFCPRPHLIDATTGTFCNYSRDFGRCAACLGQTADLEISEPEVYRARFADILERASSVITPSAFLRDTYRQLFPAVKTEFFVVEPATRFEPSQQRVRRNSRPHIAVIGGLKEHKGGVVAIDLARQLRQHDIAVRMTVYGESDPQLVEQARGLIRIRGYYRSGELSGLLARDGVDAAVLPSIWPESYGLVVDESLRAGVPVVAFDLGAVGPRLRELGICTPPHLDSGAGGLANALIALLENPPRAALERASEHLPTPESAARAYLEIYDDIINARDRNASPDEESSSRDIHAE